MFQNIHMFFSCQMNKGYIGAMQVMTRYMREQLQRIIEYYQGPSVQSGFLTAGPTAGPSIDVTTRQWTFGAQLAQHLYDEGLLDKHDYLSWIIELLEKVKYAHDLELCNIINLRRLL